MKIHFIGIGGIGLSALAQYYLAKGQQVSGSDLARSEITDLLAKKGAQIYLGIHQKESLSTDVKQVIYSPAVAKDNPEVVEAKKRKLKVQTYPQALGELTRRYFTIAVSGTHGKSTVTAMLSLILIKAGLDPTVILGTKLKEFRGSNFRMGKSEYLVIEADEWQASFLNYWPKIIVLTNIEKEHLDYYRNLDHILRTYHRFISRLPREGVLVANREDGNIKTLIREFANKTNSAVTRDALWFSAKQKEAQTLRRILKVPGEHNVLNGLAALSVARVLKVPDKISFNVLRKYNGAWRRFEEKKIIIGRLSFIVISDYAHHPTEVLATLKAAREKYPQKKIWCLFQPHQYQRTFYLWKNFIRVFRHVVDRKEKNIPLCDRLIITDIFDVAGRESGEITEKVSAERLVKLTARPEVAYLAKKSIVNYLKKRLPSEALLIVMGAGDIYKVVHLLAGP